MFLIKEKQKAETFECGIRHLYRICYWRRFLRLAAVKAAHRLFIKTGISL